MVVSLRLMALTGLNQDESHKYRLMGDPSNVHLLHNVSGFAVLSSLFGNVKNGSLTVLRTGNFSHMSKDASFPVP